MWYERPSWGLVSNCRHFVEGSLQALVDRDNGEIVVILPRLVISCYLLPLLPSALASKLGQN